MGTTRLAVAFGAGLIGILYLTIAIVPLASGMIEIWPASLSIDTAESEGFPEPWYLNVPDGHIVFSVADVRLDGDEGQDRELVRLTAPVVSESLLETWRANTEQGELLDASRLRLLVSFNAEQVARLWPEIKTRAEAGHPLEQGPVKMALAGETEPAQYMVFKPREFERRTRDFDWKKARWLRFERHFQSPGRFLKNLAAGSGLLLLSFVVFRYHRSRPDDVATNVLDWSAVPGVSDAGSGLDDIDLDV